MCGLFGPYCIPHVSTLAASTCMSPSLVRALGVVQLTAALVVPCFIEFHPKYAQVSVQQKTQKNNPYADFWGSLSMVHPLSRTCLHRGQALKLQSLSPQCVSLRISLLAPSSRKCLQAGSWGNHRHNYLFPLSQGSKS